MTLRSSLLLGAALLFLRLGPPRLNLLRQLRRPQPAQPRLRQQPSAAPTGSSRPAGDETGEEEPIVVVGHRPRGSVIGDIPPENTLDARDVRATGATNINELLDALAPQIGSAQGRGGEQPGAAAQWPAHLELPRASRHSDRSDPAGRDPARGSRAQIWLSRRPEGREHRPSPALPLDGGAGRRRRSRPTAAMPAATPTSPA